MFGCFDAQSDFGGGSDGNGGGLLGLQYLAEYELLATGGTMNVVG